MSDPDSKERPGTVEVDAVQIVEDVQPPPLPGSTVEVQAVQIVAERSSRPPPPLPGSTVEVQAVQILEERASPAVNGIGKAQVVRLEEELAQTQAPIFRLTTEEVDWHSLDPLEADLLIRFAFGATIEAIVRASGVEPGRARQAIDRLIRSGLLVR